MTSLAAQTAASSGQISPGVLGFLVVAGIGVALVFLLLSMNRHLRKISFDEDADQGGVVATAANTAGPATGETGPDAAVAKESPVQNGPNASSTG